MKLFFCILCPNPQNRVTIDEVLAHEWVNQPVDIRQYVWEHVIRDTEFHGNTAGDFNRDEEYTKGNFYIKTNPEPEEAFFNNQESEKQNECNNLNLDRMNLVNNVINNDENSKPEENKLCSKPKFNQQQIAVLSKSF